VLKSLGKHPSDDEAIEILDGKYGAYVKHGKVNVSLTKEQTVEGLTLEEALSMLASKSGKSTSKRTKSASSEPKKTTTKKTTTKSAATKATTTKTAAKTTKKAATTKKTAATK
jgi:DNA topoisomerase-1